MEKRFSAILLSLALVLAAVLPTSGVEVSAKKATVKSVTVESSLSGDKKTVYVAKGKTVKLDTTVNVKPSNKKNKKVTYKSANSKVAKVNSKGAVKGVKPGTTKITVTSKANKKKKAKITVKVMKTAVSKVKLKQTKATLNVGQSLTLKAIVTAKKGAVKKVGWKSSNSKVATVSNKGVVKAVNGGTATITAQAIDGSGKKATCKVTVPDTARLVGMDIVNSDIITFSLSKPAALSASQISIRRKMLPNSAYNGKVSVGSVTTTDKVNYTVSLDSSVWIGDYVQLSIPGSTLEKQYLKPKRAYTDNMIVTGVVGGKFDFSYSLDEDFDGAADTGYSKYSAVGLPNGLKIEESSYGVNITGTPASVGIFSSRIVAVDEVGSTFTQNVTFVIGSATALRGAALPEYTLASDEGSAQIPIRVAGGSGSYKYKITGAAQGAYFEDWSIDEDGYSTYGYLSIPSRTPGTYKVNVEAVDQNNPALKCTVTVVLNVAAGIKISGYVKDATGSPMSGVRVEFDNVNETDLYCSYAYGYTNGDSNVYSALIAPGTYNVEVDRSYSSEAASAVIYMRNQSFTAARSGYDLSLPLYKVSLVPGSGVDEDDFDDWYINEESAGYGSTLYLRQGTYTLSSGERTIRNSSNEQRTGDWFNGEMVTVTTTETRYELKASVQIGNAAVQASVSKTVLGAATTSSYTANYPGAKDTPYSLSDGYDYLPETEIYDSDDDWYDDIYQALSADISEAGSYVLSSDNGNVNLYDAEGTVIEPDSDSYVEDAAHYEKQYGNLEPGTYYVGTGDYHVYDSGIYLEKVQEQTEP